MARPIRTVYAYGRVCRHRGAWYASGAYTLHAHQDAWVRVYRLAHCGACDSSVYARRADAVRVYAHPAHVVGLVRNSGLS